MIRSRYLVAMAALTIIGGCDTLGGATQEEAKLVTTRQAGAEVLTYPGSLRGAYLFKPGSSAKFCAEPPPDVALNTLKDISANLKAAAQASAAAGAAPQGSIDTGVSSKVTTDVVQLAGRTQLILLARELLYRICELSAQGERFDSGAAQRMYSDVLKLIAGMVDADKAMMESRRLEAEAERAKALTAAGDKIDKILGR